MKEISTIGHICLPQHLSTMHAESRFRQALCESIGVEGHLGIPPGPRGVPVGWGSTVDPGRLEGQLWIPGSCRTTWGS